MDTWLNPTYKLALESLPSTLSIPLKTIADKIEKKNYAEAFDCLLKFFEMSVQYLSCILFLQIQKKDRYNDTLEKVVIYIYCKPSLSFGDWVNAIFRGLCKESRKLLPEHPLIKPLTEKTVKAILDGEPDLVKIRNKKAHGTILSDTECQEKINALKPRFDAMLTLLQPLQQWDYLTCCQQENISLKGCNTPCSIESSHNLEELHYYIRFSEEDLFDLYPLICHEEKFVYVFQTIKRGGGIGYISSDENAPENPNKNNVDDFYKCVAKTYPAWKTILARTKTASLQFIEQAQKDKKYNKDFFVDREKLTKFFQDFCNSDKRLFSLPGEAGQGKTSQLCNWTEKLIEDGKSVLIFSSSDFSAQNTKDKESPLEQKLRAVFDDSSDIKMEVLLDNIHEKASEQNEYIYFFFDAINECLTYSHSKGETETSNGPLSLYKDIVKFLVERDYPHFKVLFTCRSYTWGKSIRPEIKEEKQHLFGEDKDITVHGFTDKELEEAFQKYQDLYQMETCFQYLERRVAIRLKDPLMLKIACTNYLSKELPADTDYYTSISLFEKMVDDIKTSYAGNGQYQIIYEIANYIFDRYEHETPEDSVSLNNLPPVFEKLINNENGKTPAYYELFNRTERPVLRLSSTNELQFVYERFLEYMMALVFVERGELNAKSFVDELKKVKQNAVFLGAMRNALIMHLRKTKDLTIILQLIKENGEDLEIKYLLTETLNVLINENHEQSIFELINKLINEQIPNSIINIKKFNDNENLIDNNKANEEVMKNRNEAYIELLPLLRLREYAVVSVVNGLFMTDYFNEELYDRDVFQLLWKLMTDQIKEVQNNTCLHVYYLANKTHTLGHSDLKENLTQRIAREMYKKIKTTSIPKLAFHPKTRKDFFTFFENAGRLSFLLIIDATSKDAGTNQVWTQINEVRSIVKYFTLNFNLLRVSMLFIEPLMQKQLLVQTDYVNNIIEYQNFWKNIPQNVSETNQWSRKTLKDVVKFANFQVRNSTEQFMTYHPHISAAYKTGDAFSYLALERILILMGVRSWFHIRPVLDDFFKNSRQSEWFDYSQMSLIYVLYQTEVNIPETNEEIVDWSGRECADWTRRCKGLFRAPNSGRANSSGKYKRNVMTWYGVVYCTHSGDNVPRKGDTRCVPKFYELLDDAFREKDKELLYHLIENISELITDYGYIKTALELLKFVMSRIDSKEKDIIDKIEIERTGIYKEDIVSVIGKVLTTAKHYFPIETDNFIEKELVHLQQFPGVERYRADILNYNPSGEKIADILTHKFGNFVIKSALNEEAFGKFAYDVMEYASAAKDSSDWLRNLIRLLFRDLFNVKL